MLTVRRPRTHPWEKTAAKPVKTLGSASTLLPVKCLVGKTEMEVTKRARCVCEIRGGTDASSTSSLFTRTGGGGWGRRQQAVS